MKTEQQIKEFIDKLNQEMGKYGTYEEGIGWIVHPGLTKKEQNQMSLIRAQIVTLKWAIGEYND